MGRKERQSYDWRGFAPDERAVIAFVRRDGELLLIHKKRGFGGGKINGPGGRIEPGESSTEAAIREVAEEVGLRIESPQRMADLKFAFTDGYTLEVDVYVTARFHGDPTETDEAKPFWTTLDEIPYDRMWEDDRLWLPRVLRGEYVSGRFVFHEDRMIESELSADRSD